jgi:hypothetical protein
MSLGKKETQYIVDDPASNVDGQSQDEPKENPAEEEGSLGGLLGFIVGAVIDVASDD